MKKSAQVVVTSDHHIGSTVGLCPPEVYLDDGGEYKQTKLQAEAWKFWDKDFWPYVWKQAKSRKSVRAVAVIGPWHPHAVMYTVPRAGQMGFHQRIEYNKKVLLVDTSEKMSITPQSGFPHFGIVKGDFVVVAGSVAGPARRPVTLRLPIRARSRKITPATILQVSTVKS